MIQQVGKLIFSAVYSIWFMFKKYKMRYRVRGEIISLPDRYSREFYHRPLKDIRDAIEKQVESSNAQQDIQTLQNISYEAQQLIARYNSDIAEGKKHVLNNSPPVCIEINTGTTVKGNAKQVTNFENGGVQVNGH